MLIRNPGSRHALTPAMVEQIIAFGHARGWAIEAVQSERPGHATELARAAARAGIEVVIASGGDGTVNQAINGIAGTATALAVLPGGTANVWAREMHISREPLQALQTAIEGEVRRVDVGRANDRYFLLMAGVGLDGTVIERVSATSKRRLGAASYLIAGVPAAIATHTRQVQLEIDGHRAETPLYWMVIGNTRSYGGFRDITHRAQADDGWLDVAIMQRGGLFHLLVDGIRLLRGRHDRSPNVRYLKARGVVVETAGLPVQVDGEPHGETPMTFEVVPRALAVIVPAGVRTPVLGDEPA